MSKHSKELKQSVVNRYLSGMSSYKEAGEEYGLDYGTVQKWVAAYRVHGQASLEKKYSHYSAAFKRLVLKHMREYALSYRETAAYFDIRNGSILSTWERQYDAGGIQALSPRQRGRRKKMPQYPLTPHPSLEMSRRVRANSYLRKS